MWGEHREKSLDRYQAFVRRSANGLPVDKKYKWRRHGPGAQRQPGLRGPPTAAAREAGRDIVADFADEAPVCDRPRWQLKQIATAKLSDQRASSNSDERNFALQWQRKILEGEQVIKHEIDVYYPRFGYALPADKPGSVCTLSVRGEPAGTSTQLVQQPRGAVWPKGSYTDLAIGRTFDVRNSKFGGGIFTSPHFVTSIDQRAIVARLGARGVLFMDGDPRLNTDIVMSAKIPTKLQAWTAFPSRNGQQRYKKLMKQALRILGDSDRGNERWGARHAFLTHGARMDTTTRCTMAHSVGHDDCSRVEFMSHCDELKAMYKYDMYEPISRIFAVEHYLVAKFYRDHKLYGANWGPNANGASSGFAFVNMTHDDDDAAPTTLLVGMGTCAGGEFGHAHHGLWHETHVGDLLYVNPKKPHSTAEMSFTPADAMRCMTAGYNKADVVRGLATGGAMAEHYGYERPAPKKMKR